MERLCLTLDAGWARLALCICLPCTLAACDAYKSELLSAAPSAQSVRPLPTPTGGVGGSSVTSAGGSAGAGGTGGGSAISTTPGDVVLAGQTRCGDGQVTGEEKCDISITAGTPGACPTECPMLSECTPRGLNGAGCQAECVVLQVSCKGGDGCCPGSCTHATDSDCSGACGNGTVETPMGETCEAGSSTPCPTMADCDDKNACTTDMLMGSASNCNAACVHTDVTTVMNGDMCCPPGANSNTDSDCAPVCGNGVHEGNEECDGGPGCDAQCKSTLTVDQQRCISKFSADDCDRCSCISCTSQFLACRDSATASANDQCNAVLTCSRANNCVGKPCYCGTDTSVNCGWGTPAGPLGLCAREIEAAAGAGWGDAVAVNTQSTNQSSPLGRAYTADMCRVANCVSVCR